MSTPRRYIRRSPTAGLVWLCVALAPFAQAHQHRTGRGEHTIRGAVVDPDRLRSEGAVLMLGREVDDASFQETPVDVAPDGSFATARVKSGTYFLRIVRTPHSPTQPANTIAFEIVRVGTSDVSGVTVTIRRDTAVSGSFRMETDTTGAPWPAHIVVNAFLALEGMPMLSAVVADGAPEGRFVLRNAFGPRVLRCGYTLRPGANWWPARVLLDGVDITNVATDFSAHERGRLEIVFTQHPARIKGTVVDTLGEPVRAPWILVMSAEPALQQDWATTNHAAQGNTKGTFTIAVTPGRYLVAAAPQTTFRFNPWVEARRNIQRFASRGTAVTVKEREATTVTIGSR
jgi:hypothetical protein